MKTMCRFVLILALAAGMTSTGVGTEPTRRVKAGASAPTPVQGPGGKGSDEQAAPASQHGDLPAKITASVSIRSYGFVPVKQDYSIDQPQPDANLQIELQRSDHRMPFGAAIPCWSGSNEVTLKAGYRVKIKAVYMLGKPAGDFVRPVNGLSINVSYFYEKQLLDFESATVWGQQPAAKATASLKDIPYCDLLSQNEFEIPSEVSGYMEGFRYWVAARDGLNKKVGNSNYDSLSKFLKPLKRESNLVLAHVGVECHVAGVPAANTAENKKQ